MKKTTTKMNDKLAKEVIDTAADAVVSYIGLHIMAELLVEIAKSMDADEWPEICDQLQALVLYPDYAMKPDVPIR